MNIMLAHNLSINPITIMKFLGGNITVQWRIIVLAITESYQNSIEFPGGNDVRANAGYTLNACQLLAPTLLGHRLCSQL